MPDTDAHPNGKSGMVFESISRYTTYERRYTVFRIRSLNIQLCQIYDVLIQQHLFVLAGN